MSTRRDGLTMATASRTVRHILQAHGVEVIGGNRRILVLRRCDGGDVEAATGQHGSVLASVLAMHGFALHHRRGKVLVDLLECRVAGRSAELAELVARRAEDEARADWTRAQAQGEEAPGASAAEHGTQVGNESYRWAIHETAAYLRHRLAAP